MFMSACLWCVVTYVIVTSLQALEMSYEIFLIPLIDVKFVAIASANQPVNIYSL